MFVKLHEWEMKEKAKKEGYEEGFESGREKGIQVGIQQGIEQGIERGIQKGIFEGAEQTKIETAKKLLLEKIPIEIISKATSLSLEKIQELASEVTK